MKTDIEKVYDEVSRLFFAGDKIGALKYAFEYDTKNRDWLYPKKLEIIIWVDSSYKYRKDVSWRPHRIYHFLDINELCGREYEIVFSKTSPVERIGIEFTDIYFDEDNKEYIFKD